MKAIIFTSFLILSLVPLLAQNPDPTIRDTALYKQLAEYMPLLLEDSGLGTNSVATFGKIYVGMPGGGAAFAVNYSAESEFTGTINVDSIAFNGDPATTRANMGLGWSALTNSNAATRLLGYSTNGGVNAVVAPYLRFTNTVETAGLFIGSYIDWEEGFNGLPASTTRTNLGLGATNAVQFGALTVASLNTTTPSKWVLDAMQTNSSIPSSSTLTLPDNANVVRLTNNNTGGGFNYSIQKIANGQLGAFYYLVNQSDYPITINNANGISVQSGSDLTLGVNQAVTLIATGPTNASVAARGDLNNVTLVGTANLAPSQTASSFSSLMTRSLSDTRFYPLASFWLPAEDMQSYNSAGAGNPEWTTTAGVMNMVTPFGRSPRTMAAPDATGISQGIYTIPAGWPAGAQVRVTTYLALFNSATTNTFSLLLGGYWTTNTNIISPVATSIGAIFPFSSTLTTNVTGTGTTNEYFKISTTFSLATNANVENRQVTIGRLSTSTNDTATNTIYFIGSQVELLP